MAAGGISGEPKNDERASSRILDCSPRAAAGAPRKGARPLTTTIRGLAASRGPRGRGPVSGPPRLLPHLLLSATPVARQPAPAGGRLPSHLTGSYQGATDGACARGAQGRGPRARGGRAPGVPWRHEEEREVGPGPNGESPRIPPKTAGRPRRHPAGGVRRHRGESARRHRSWSAKLHRAWGALRPSASGLSKTPWRRPLGAGRRARPKRKRALPRESSPPGCWVGRDDRHRSRGESTSEPPRLSERGSGTASRIGISRRRPYAGPSGSRPPRPR